MLLQQSGAEALDVKGRALAWIPGREMVTMQTPIIGHDDIMTALSGQGPRSEMPGGEQGEPERIRDLARQGMSKRQIELTMYGYSGGSAHSKVNEVLLQ